MSLCLSVVLCLRVRVSVLKFQPHHCIVSGLLSWRASALNLPCVTPQTPSGLGIICYQAGACRVPGNPRGKLCNTVHCSHTEILWCYCTFNQRLLHLLYYRKVLGNPSAPHCWHYSWTRTKCFKHYNCEKYSNASPPRGHQLDQLEELAGIFWARQP